MNVRISSKTFNGRPGSVHTDNNNIYIAAGDNKSVQVIQYKSNNGSLNKPMVLH